MSGRSSRERGHSCVCSILWGAWRKIVKLPDAAQKSQFGFEICLPVFRQSHKSYPLSNETQSQLAVSLVTVCKALEFKLTKYLVVAHAPKASIGHR